MQTKSAGHRTGTRREFDEMKLNIFNYELYEYSRMQSFSHSEKTIQNITHEKSAGVIFIGICPLSAFSDMIHALILQKIQYWNYGLKLITGGIDH